MRSCKWLIICRKQARAVTAGTFYTFCSFSIAVPSGADSSHHGGKRWTEHSVTHHLGPRCLSACHTLSGPHKPPLHPSHSLVSCLTDPPSPLRRPVHSIIPFLVPLLKLNPLPEMPSQSRFSPSSKGKASLAALIKPPHLSHGALYESLTIQHLCSILCILKILI